MPIIFDPDNKFILITSPTLEVDALEVYSRAMDWAAESENMVYQVPMTAAGKLPLGGGTYTDSIFQLANGWLIKWWSGDKQVVIIGTLIPEEVGGNYTVPPDTGQVELTVKTCSAATIVESSGSEAVWTASQRQQIMTLVSALAQGRARLDDTLKQCVLYDVQGNEVARFNTFKLDGTPSITDVTERVPV